MTEQVIGLMAAIIPPILKLIHSTYSDRVRNDSIDKIAELYDLMYDFLNNTSCYRLLIMKTENNGGELSVTTPLYVSVLHEVVEGTPIRLKKDFQRVLLDDTYITVLKSLTIANIVHVNSDIVEHGLLRELILSEKRKNSDIFLIRKTKKALYFGQIFTTNDLSIQTNEEELLRLRLFVNSLRKLFNVK